MLFVPTPSPKPIVDYLADTISQHLVAGPVLWLVSGGSCVPIAFQTASRLGLTATHLDRLTISLVDERFGPVGHAGSNWTALEQAGFKVAGATLQPVLTPGADMATTAKAFSEFLDQQLGRSYSIGLLGIGADGHTAGIKPHSPAVTAEGLVCAYDGDDYHRITMAPEALARLGEAAVYVAGQAKWPVLDALETTLSPDDQPAQFLKAIERVMVFTDRPAPRATP